MIRGSQIRCASAPPLSPTTQLAYPSTPSNNSPKTSTSPNSRTIPPSSATTPTPSHPFPHTPAKPHYSCENWASSPLSSALGGNRAKGSYLGWKRGVGELMLFGNCWRLRQNVLWRSAKLIGTWTPSLESYSTQLFHGLMNMRIHAWKNSILILLYDSSAFRLHWAVLVCFFRIRPSLVKQSFSSPLWKS